MTTEERLAVIENAIEGFSARLGPLTEAVNALVRLQQPSRFRRFMESTPVILFTLGLVGTIAGVTTRIVFSVLDHGDAFTLVREVTIPNGWANFEALADGQLRLCQLVEDQRTLCVRVPIKQPGIPLPLAPARGGVFGVQR